MPAGGIRRRERWSGAVSNRRPSAFQVDGSVRTVWRSRCQAPRGGGRRCLMVLAVAVPRPARATTAFAVDGRFDAIS